MATDEEIERFVTDNREIIGRMMDSQRGNARAAELSRRSEEFFVSVYSMFADPEVQRHFMASGLEFIEGMKVLIGNAPVPGFVRTAATDFGRSARTMACRANKDCPAKAARKIKIETTPRAPAPEETAE
jgi:hypothetical protein